MRTGLLLGLSLASLSVPALAAAPSADKEVAASELAGKPALQLSVLRQRLADGGLKLRLSIVHKGDKKKPALVTLYEGGADDDGPTDKAFRSASVEPFALPGGHRGARVDFEFQVPGSKKHRQVDTYVVSLGDAPRLVLDTTTRRERDRTKVCHEVEEAQLILEKDGKLFVRPTSVLESELNDDDLPIDKTCRGKHPGPATTFKWDGETFLQIDPPAGGGKKKPAEESDD
jgi:hypothetical protein